MSILLHCTFTNSSEWKKKIKQKFKNKKIISINDTNMFNADQIAIVWNLPKELLKKLPKLYFHLLWRIGFVFIL